MAFNSPIAGDTILHTDVTQFVNNWTGVAGFGVPFENIQVNDSAKYAGDFQNLDTTNSNGLRVRDSAGSALLTAVLAGCTLSKTTTLSRGTITTDLKVLDASATWNAAVTFTALKLNVTDTSSNAASLLLDLQVGGTTKLNVTKAGAVSAAGAILPVTTDGGALGSATLMWSDLFLASGAVINFNNGDVTITHGANYLNLAGVILFIEDTANVNMTVGLTINQGANDDAILALKSSDVAHGVTDYSETDTYFTIVKVGGADGGAMLRGFSDANVSVAIDAIGNTDDTT